MTNEPRPVASTFGSYGYAWHYYKKYFLYLFLVGLIVGAAHVPAALIRPDGPGEQLPVLLLLLVSAYNLLILPVFKYGGDLLTLRYMRDERAEIGGVLVGFRKNYLNIVLASLLVFAIVMIGFVLLIIPGIVFACRLAFVPYLVMDKNLDPVAAVEKSWNMSRGYGFSVFGVFLVAIPLTLVGLLLLGVGAYFALLWVGAAMASLYHAIDVEDQQLLDTNGAAEA